MSSTERHEWQQVRRGWTSAPPLSGAELEADASGSHGSSKVEGGVDRLERAVLVDMEDALETLFSRDGQFTQEIPLPQLVDILVDVWEANGHFD
jgi:hypothetical protein